MAYDNFGITTKGYELLATATTGAKIIMVGGRCSQNTISQADIPSATDADFLGIITGTIKAMSVTDTAAQVIVEFSNAGLQLTYVLKSFCIYARLQGVVTAYPFAVCSLNDGGITIQPQSITGVEVRFQVPFDLTFEGASEYITGIPVGNNASVDMLDRFVSLHSLGDTESGDDQTILGMKTFSDETTFDDVATFNRQIETRNIMPSNSNLYNLGADDLRFDEVWARNLHGAVPTAEIKNNTVSAQRGSIMCIKRSVPSTDLLQVGSLLTVSSPSTYDVSSLDGQVYGHAPMGIYQIITPKPAALNSADTEGNKPFLVIFMTSAT